MKQELISRIIPATSPDAWAEAMGAEHPETSYSAAYHLMSQRIWGGEASLAVVERDGNRLLWPYVMHPIPARGGYWDINSAYGFVGPLLTIGNPATESRFVEQALDHLMLLWRDMRVVSAFTRFCPFHENQRPLEYWLSGNPNVRGSIEALGHTVAIDLAVTPEERWHQYQPSLRGCFKKAARLGIEGEYDPNWERFDDFFSIYESVGQRNAFQARHRLSREAFLTMRECLGSNAKLFHGMHNGRIAASKMFVTSGKIIHGLFAGPHPDYVGTEAYKYLNKIAADWAAGQGYHYLHIGGGRGGDDSDSLYQFKRAFSKVRLPFYVGRFILNESVYEELTREAHSRYSAQGLEPSHRFFPAYRDPGQQAADARPKEVAQAVSTGVEA